MRSYGPAMTTQRLRDPRPLLARSLDQLARQVEAVRRDELGNRTPCADYDVRALLGHVLAVLHKIARAGSGSDVRGEPDVVVGIEDDGWTVAIAGARAEVAQVWADDATLGRAITLPWATMPGRDVLDAYTHEFTVHAWDLAHATGRVADLDPGLAAEALDAFPRFAPPDERDGPGPFGPVVAVPDDADVYTRLAAYLGREP